MEDVKICRICFEDNNELISPCRCSGTSKWIHLECLQKWRFTSTNPNSVIKCSTCNTKYNITYISNNSITKFLFTFLCNYPSTFYMINYIFIILGGYILYNINLTIYEQKNNKIYLFYLIKYLITSAYSLYSFYIFFILFILIKQKYKKVYFKEFPKLIFNRIIFGILVSMGLIIINILISTLIFSISIFVFLKYHLHVSEKINNTYNITIHNYTTNLVVMNHISQ